MSSTAIVEYDGSNLMDVVRSRGTRVRMAAEEFTIPYVEGEQEQLRYCAYHKRMEPAANFSNKQLFNSYHKRFCLEWSNKNKERAAVALDDEPWFSDQDVVRMQNILNVNVPGYTQAELASQRKETAAEAANEARTARAAARSLDPDTIRYDALEDEEIDIVGRVPGPDASGNERTAAAAGSKRKQPAKNRAGTRNRKSAKGKGAASSSGDAPDPPVPVRDDQLLHWLALNLKFMPAFKDTAEQRELKGEMADRDAFNPLAWLVSLDEGEQDEARIKAAKSEIENLNSLIESTGDPGSVVYEANRKIKARKVAMIRRTRQKLLMITNNTVGYADVSRALFRAKGAKDLIYDGNAYVQGLNPT